MASPAKKTPNWLWIIILAVLAVLLIAWMLDPSGDADDGIEDAVSLPQDGYVAVPADPAAVPVELPTAVPTIGDPAISATPLPGPSPMATPPMASPPPQQAPTP